MGEGGGVACSSQRDARSSSLQRMVRRAVGFGTCVEVESGNAGTRWRRPNHRRRKAGTQRAHGTTKDEKAGPVETRGKPEAKPWPRLRGGKPRGSDAELGTDAEAEARKIANARNLEQTFWRIVLKVDVRVRLTTPSSATAERGAVAARVARRTAYELRRKVGRSESSRT